MSLFALLKEGATVVADSYRKLRRERDDLLAANNLLREHNVKLAAEVAELREEIAALKQRKPYR